MKNNKILDENRVLCKKICKHCHENNPRKIKGWTDFKERAWEYGSVYCPAVKRSIVVTYIPKECPYDLEQKFQRQRVKAERRKKKHTYKREIWVVEECFDEENWNPCSLIKNPFYIEKEKAKSTKENLKHKFPDILFQIKKYIPEL